MYSIVTWPAPLCPPAVRVRLELGVAMKAVEQLAGVLHQSLERGDAMHWDGSAEAKRACIDLLRAAAESCALLEARLQEQLSLTAVSSAERQRP